LPPARSPGPTTAHRALSTQPPQLPGAIANNRIRTGRPRDESPSDRTGVFQRAQRLRQWRFVWRECRYPPNRRRWRLRCGLHSKNATPDRLEAAGNMIINLLPMSPDRCLPCPPAEHHAHQCSTATAGAHSAPYAMATRSVGCATRTNAPPPWSVRTAHPTWLATLGPGAPRAPYAVRPPGGRPAVARTSPGSRPTDAGRRGGSSPYGRYCPGLRPASRACAPGRAHSHRRP
ncbi:hypothetical protein SAMN05216213_11876, partial [Ectopseudomonas guguanensis]